MTTRAAAGYVDSTADLYQQARPEYPDALYHALIAAAGLNAGDRLLEAGCATGSTLPLARRGFRITCLELGPALATAARRILAGFPEVEVIESAFETFNAPAADPFDLVFAATAWHWLDPAIRYSGRVGAAQAGRTPRLLERHACLPAGRGPVLRRVARGLRADEPAGGRGVPAAGQAPDESEEIEGSGLFGDVVVLHFDWEVTYDAKGYLRLLDTFSGHIAMQPWQRDRLYSEIRRRLARRADRRVVAGAPFSTSPADWTHGPPRKPDPLKMRS